MFGQSAWGFFNIKTDTRIIQSKIETTRIQNRNDKIAKKIERNSKDKKTTRVVYQYKKKKEFKKIENSITTMRKQNEHHGGSATVKHSQPAKIAKTISGKLLISRGV